MARDLIDPMNPDTFDDRIIMHGPIRSQPPNDAYRSGWERAFGKKFKLKIIRRRKLWFIKSQGSFLTASMMSSTGEPRK